MSDNPQRSFNLEYNPPPNQEKPEDQNMEEDVEEKVEDQVDDDLTPKMQEEYAENGENDAEGDPELIARVMELENDFRMTHDADAGAELLQIYRSADDMENVRRIRESLNEHTSLSEKDWLDWINDEITTPKTDDEKKKIMNLVDRALDEALFFDVAKLGISYAKGLFSKGIYRRQGVKLRIDKAINAFLYDFNNGSKFFKKLRKFEQANTDVKNEADRDKTIRNIYERQLKLPYADIDQTINEYVTWEKNADERTKMVKIYEETYKDLALHLDFEDKFQEILDDPDDKEKFNRVLAEIVNSDQLKLEKKMNFFERCIVANPAEPTIWEKYSELADKHFRGNASALEKIYRRAVKNCPGNIEFTKSYLRVLEKLGTEPKELKEKVLAMLWHFRTSADFYFLRLQLCEIYVRSLNKKLAEARGDIKQVTAEVVWFREAIYEAIQFFSGDPTPENQAYIADLWLLRANIEAYTMKDKDEMNKCMDKYVHFNGSQFAAWRQYVTFEQALGRPDGVRRILKRGCEYTKDDVAAMFTLAIDFEKKFGSLEELDNTEKRFQEKKEKLAQEDPNNVALLVENDNLPKPIERVDKKAKTKKELTGKRRLTDKNKGDDEELEQVGHVEKQVKKTEQRQEEGRIEEEKHNKQEEQAKEEEKVSHPPQKEPIAYPEELDKKNTVFVKNLPPTFTKPDISAIFANGDKITDLRLGKTRGTAYIDFATKEDAEEACQNNNIKIDGQRLYVALSDPPKKGKDDRKTIFVNNLPFDITEEKLAEAFKKWKDHITEIRIPPAENNKAKGFAYLVLDTEPILDEVIAESRDLHIGGRKVNVEHADSSRRHQQQTLKALHVAFIRNLNFRAREEDIEEFFKDFAVKQVHLVRDKKTKKPTGIAFVEFHTMDDLRNAIALPEPKIMGRQIDISKSDRPITQSHEESQEARPKKNALSKKDATTVAGDQVFAKPKPSFPVPTQLKKMVPASASNASMGSTTAPKPAETANTTNDTNATNNAAPGMRSNNDFRALLMKKK